MFLVMAGAYAHQLGANAIAIGLLSERFSLFPDQRSDFVLAAERAIGKALGQQINVLTPLADFDKAEVVKLAVQKGISDTYSCHAGGEIPCGRCIACLEYQFESGGAHGR
jgi:7-cyano-7-deazaguanine synthase